MIEILSTESEIWNEYLSRFNGNKRDIYFTSEYHKMHEINGDGKAQCFVYKEEKNIVLYPYMLNEIEGYELNGKYYDIESVYGYSGPISNTDDKDFLLRFENFFLDYCSRSNIVAEFIRFHPVIGNSNVFSERIERIYNRKTVYIDVEKDIECIWKYNVSSKNRNMIRKAEKNGLEIVINNDYSTFIEIYKLTMDKVSADSYYYFSENYFDFAKDYKNFTLMNVIFNEETIASAIFMRYGDYFHYHLAGSIKEKLNLAPNNLLLWEAIKFAHNNNAKFMHLGGGLTDDDNDNLFKFKASFSNSFTDYYIGKRIHNKVIYDSLINQWEQRSNRKARILLQYKIKI